MKINVFPLSDAKTARRLARNTQWLADNDELPTVAQFEEWLHAEESQLDAYPVVVLMEGIPYFASVHLVRHHVGVTHYVSSQRRFENRADAPQGALVNHAMVLNPRALISISRKRLCVKADKATSAIWYAVRAAFANHEDQYMQAISKAMMADCLYRGHVCHQRNGCGVCDGWKQIKEKND